MTRYFTGAAAIAFVTLLGWARPVLAQPITPTGNPNTPGATSNTPSFGDIPQPKLAGFGIDLSFSDSTALNAENYSNGLSLYLSPSWSVGGLYLKNTPFKTLTISARFSIDRALAGYDPSSVTPDNGSGPLGTCSNVAINGSGTVDPNSVGRCAMPANNYRFTPSDLTFIVTNPAIYKIPVAEIRLNPSLRFTVPLSYQSRYATLMTAIQAGVGLSRSFLNDKLSVSYTFSFSKNFHQYATSQIQTNGSFQVSGPISNNYDTGDIASNSASYYADALRQSPMGGFNTSHGFSNSFAVNYNPTPKLSITAAYIIGSAFSYAGACDLATYNGVTTNPCENANTVAQSGWNIGTAGINIRDNQTFMLSGNYTLTNWAAVYLQWVTAGPLRDQANNVYQPFISTNYNAFTNVSLGLSVSIGHGEDE